MNDADVRMLVRLVRGDPDWPASVSADAWPRLLKRAEMADVVGLAAHQGLSRATSAPEAVRQQLLRRITFETRHHGFHFVEAERVSSAIAKHGIPVVVLKGVALSRTVYEHPACRAFRDLDLLVPPEAVDEALGILESDNYRIAPPPPVLDAYRHHHFHIPLDGPGKPHVELHWSLTRPDDPYRLEAAEMLADAAWLPDGPSYPCPHPDAQVLHAASAQLRCGFTELKRLVDLDRLVRSRAPVRWPRVIELAAKSGLASALRLLLELTHELLLTDLAEPLAATAPLGSARRRLDEIGVAGFPLGLAPSGWSPARHLVRFWLVRPRYRVVSEYLFRPRVERARLRALGVPWRARTTAGAKRAALFALVALWQLGRTLAHGRLTRAAARRESGLPAAGTAGTPGPGA